VGLGDSIRNFFNRRRNPALKSLESFATERKGVEGYIEPRTATNPTTLLLVDRDGDNVRAPVRDPADAAAFCDKLGIPVYDAQVLGYPKRMVEFERRGRGPSPKLDEEIADLERRLRDSGGAAPDN
jgi:hypothetical protein